MIPNPRVDDDRESTCTCPPTGPLPPNRFRPCQRCGRSLPYFAFPLNDPHRRLRANICVSCVARNPKNRRPA